MTPGEAARFAADLAALSPPGERIGIAVSGGPDSLALLLLATAARPGELEAATVDHRLRPGSRAETDTVATICAARAVPHAILTARWTDPPTANVQARAREERYALLADWAASRDLAAVATAHHADDQAETLVMRLLRGAGIAGLGGARPSRPLADGIALVRPVLGWRKADLAAIVAEAGLTPLDDPANRDPRHDRSRIRAWLTETPWADPDRLAASAAWLREADDALGWSLDQLIPARLFRDENSVTIDPAGLPTELQRRLLLAAMTQFGADPPRGADLARALKSLRAGATITLAGLKLEGGVRWRIAPAPPRRRA
ncbi:MAG: tRNA lysidine(34) synthetase TilS [Sphingomicrobium sp.]